VEGNVEVVFGPRRTGVGLLARYRDPDGNLVELVQPLPR
jgi:catechol 2,3-dioxygenase-like lactoylglutathione lyase family enzyme